VNGGLQAGAVFKQKPGRHLSDAQRAEVEKRAANFHPSPFELFHEQMLKRAAQKN
jgi:hypothetical protein